MTVVGRVDGLWHYPVKSMGAEELEEAFLGFSGICGAVLVEGILRRGDRTELLS